jgi:hypothetical protein
MAAAAAVALADVQGALRAALAEQQSTSLALLEALRQLRVSFRSCPAR